MSKPTLDLSLDHMRRFGDKMKSLAKVRGYSMEDISEAVGVHRSTVFDHFAGRTKPPMLVLFGYIRWAGNPHFHEPYMKDMIPSDEEVPLIIQITHLGLKAIEEAEVR